MIWWQNDGAVDPIIQLFNTILYHHHTVNTETPEANKTTIWKGCVRLPKYCSYACFPELESPK